MLFFKLLIALIATVCVLVGCSEQSVTIPVQPEYIVLWNGSYGSLGRVYIIHDDSIFVCNHGRMGDYENAEWFQAEMSPIDINVFLSEVTLLDPSFEPGGPGGHCTLFDEHLQEIQVLYWDSNSTPSQEMFEKLEDSLSMEWEQIEEVPDWIGGHPELTRFFIVQ